MISGRIFTKFIIAFLFVSLLLIGTTFPALSEETYVFERMWPTLQQPWYFTGSVKIAMDSKGYIYSADFSGGNISKFSSDGQFVKSWAPQRYCDSAYAPYPWGPYDIAIDANDNIYAAIGGEILKFSTEAEFILRWGQPGEGDGEFNFPRSLVVDKEGNVYVADIGNQRIQKFTSEGVFLKAWGSEGSNNGEFKFIVEGNWYPSGLMAIDSNGFIYVLDNGNYRIQKLSPEGDFETQWEYDKDQNGDYLTIVSIEVDKQNNVYLGYDMLNDLSIFTPDGKFLTTLYSHGSTPSSLIFDIENFIYVFHLNYRDIKK